MKRQCGDCTLCCKLLPVPELKKLAGARCVHQRTHKGCAVYHRRPLSCLVWSCGWLTEEGAVDLRRPDRSHYVIDPMPDFVTMTYDDEPPRRVPVVQIWNDPKYPDAHRDPALRAYIAKLAERTPTAAIVRYNNEDAVVLFPPSLASDGQWHEERSAMRQQQHTFKEIAEVLQGG